MKETTFYYTVKVKISYDENLTDDEIQDLVVYEIDYDFKSFDRRITVIDTEILEVTNEL